MQLALSSILFAALVFGSEAVPKEKPARAIPLKIDAFKDGIRLCSRKGPEGVSGYWEVQQDDVARIDQALMKHITQNRLTKNLTLAPDGYVRQYLGMVRAGKRIAYINAYPARAAENLSKAAGEFAKGCDGGGLFWGIEYDLQTRTFMNFATNSSLQGDPLEGLRL